MLTPPQDDLGTDRRVVVAVALLFLLSLLAASALRFVQDDAFISFLYARNLVDGEGLTWFGNRVEGYTNFLWVLWIAFGMKLNIDPIVWAQLGGLCAWAVTIHAMWNIGRRLLQSEWAAVLALLLFVTNYTNLAYATGGLETMLQTALLSQATWLVVQMCTRSRVGVGTAVSLSVLLAMAVLVRLDSAVAASVLVGFALYAEKKQRRKRVALLAIPFGLITMPWLAWKLAYYGDLLPNTFYAKLGGRTSEWVTGLAYVGRYLHWYMLWPFLLAGGALLVARRWRLDLGQRLLLLLVCTWYAYVIFAGGDFMEFRFLVPVAPMLFLLVAGIAHDQLGGALFGRPRLVAILAIVVLAAASTLHANRFRGQLPDLTLDSIHQLSTFYERYPDENWSRIGAPLREAFADIDVVLAAHAAGAIPFYSGLRTVDMWGLCDPVIARGGIPVDANYRRPGHRRYASLEYLQGQGVHFILAHPAYVPIGALQAPSSLPRLQAWVRSAIGFDRTVVPRATLVVMPLNAQQGLLMWYFTPSPAIHSRLRQLGWEVATVPMGR